MPASPLSAFSQMLKSTAVYILLLTITVHYTFPIPFLLSGLQTGNGGGKMGTVRNKQSMDSFLNLALLSLLK